MDHWCNTSSREKDDSNRCSLHLWKLFGVESDTSCPFIFVWFMLWLPLESWTSLYRDFLFHKCLLLAPLHLKYHLNMRCYIIAVVLNYSIRTYSAFKACTYSKALVGVICLHWKKYTPWRSSFSFEHFFLKLTLPYIISLLYKRDSFICFLISTKLFDTITKNIVPQCFTNFWKLKFCASVISFDFILN